MTAKACLAWKSFLQMVILSVSHWETINLCHEHTTSLTWPSLFSTLYCREDVAFFELVSSKKMWDEREHGHWRTAISHCIWQILCRGLSISWPSFDTSARSGVSYCLAGTKPAFGSWWQCFHQLGWEGSVAVLADFAMNGTTQGETIFWT